MRRGEETRTEAFLSSMDCYPLTGAIARRAGSLKSAWAQKGRTLSLVDMMVAATALEHGLSLMTDNRKDFPLPELNLYPLTLSCSQFFVFRICLAGHGPVGLGRHSKSFLRSRALQVLTKTDPTPATPTEATLQSKGNNCR